MSSRVDANDARKPAPAIVRVSSNACAAGIFVINAFNDLHTDDVIATDRSRLKARRVDSESQILAIKKFSCSPALRLIAARQNRFFERIACA
jgi:hypothetical protein